LRVDKLTYAALEATLLAYVRQDHNAIPALRMMRLSVEEVGRRAQALADTLRATKDHVGPAAPGRAGEQSSPVPKLHVELIDGASVIGGGAAPGATLPTVLLAVSCQGLSADELAARLRAHQPPIVARVEQGKVLLDLRTIFPEQDAIIAEALSQCA